MHVIGTAGHVDHGKSTLIAALTGVHPDRLKEEQEREMTIDLGFGWLTLPNGEEVGIVDVPGHRDFIENMLAGVGGIDAALLVIAADEGIMPQTREHLAILNLLQIQTGLVVLTKIDLVNDPEWLTLIEKDIRESLKGTFLQVAPILRVSARTKEGLPELVTQIGRVLEQARPRVDLGRPRLPIDRVFSLTGFGTVVTGTLADGHLSTGAEVELLPSGLRARIRGLQTHKKNETTAAPGSRTAVNLAGVEVEQVHRGEVVCLPGKYQPTQRLDLSFHLLPETDGPLRHHSEVKLFLGTSEAVATVRVLGQEALQPGETGWLQLELRQPILAAGGDRFILRRPSPPETLGGGTVVDPHPAERHKRFDAELILRLETRLRGSPRDLILQASQLLGPTTVKALLAQAHLEATEAIPALEELVAGSDLIRLDDLPLGSESLAVVVAPAQWFFIRDSILRATSAYHETYPLRRGIPKEELKSKLKLSPTVFTLVIHRLSTENELTEGSKWAALPTHQVRFSPFQQVKVDWLLQKFAAMPTSPPTIKECKSEVGEEVFNILLESGDLVAVSPEVVFQKTDYDLMVEKVQRYTREKGQVTLAEVRDLLQTSRRYVQALLEYLDETGETIREGDSRRLAK